MNLIVGQIFKKLFTKEGLMILLFIVSIVFGVMFFMAKNEARTERMLREQQKEIFDQNLSAIGDSITKKFDKKLGEFEFSKDAFVTSLDNLARYDEALYKHVSGIEGNIINVIKSEVGGLMPPRSTDGTLDSLGNGNYALNWAFPYADSGLTQYIGGNSRFRYYNKQLLPGKATLDSNYFKLNLVYGFKELNDKYEIFARCPSPYVELESLTGAYFIDKPPPFMPPAPGSKPFSVGPYIGWGVNWDNSLQNPRTGWSMGIAVHYNIFSFGKARLKKSDNWFKKGTEEILGNRILEHKVDTAETLYAISAKYGMSVLEIKQLNNLTEDVIYPGQILWVSL